MYAFFFLCNLLHNWIDNEIIAAAYSMHAAYAKKCKIFKINKKCPWHWDQTAEPYVINNQMADKNTSIFLNPSYYYKEV